MYEDAVERQTGLLRALDDFNASGSSGKQAWQVRDRLLADLNAVNVALGEPIVEDDPVVAQWERDLQAGKMPDLSTRRQHG